MARHYVLASYDRRRNIEFGNTGLHPPPVRQRRVRVGNYGECDGGEGTEPVRFYLTRDQAGDIFEATDRSAHPAAMTNAFENFAIPIDLPQLPLRLTFITTVNHQAINDQSDPGSDTKAVFRKNGWMHGKAHERQ